MEPHTEPRTSLFFTASTYRRLQAWLLDSIIVLFIRTLFIGFLFLWKGIPFLTDLFYGEGAFLESFMENPSFVVMTSFSIIIPLILAWETLSFLYHWLFLAFYGATLGKMALGLQVVFQSKEKEQKGKRKKEEEQPGLGFLSAFIRVFSVAGFQFFISLAYAMFAFFNTQRAHLGDHIAGTKVIQTHPLPNPPVPRPFCGVLLIIFFFVFGRLSSQLLLVLFWLLDKQNL